MNTTRSTRAAAIAASMALLIAACGSPTSDSPSSESKTDVAPTGGALDKTFVLTLPADPGALDPALSVSNTLNSMAAFIYDPLVNVDLEGNVVSGLATSWEQQADKVTFTIKEGVTCSDGSAFTAQTAADNINFVADPENASPWLGVGVPVGARAEADGATLTMNLDQPAPFVLIGLSAMFLVCDAGLADRSILVGGATGTGPYTLEEIVPNDHYTFKIRKEYTWGPAGAAAAGSAMPGTVTMRVIESETTAANLLLAKEANGGVVSGADADRLDAAGLAFISSVAVTGEQWYNQANGHVTADPAVRAALAQSVDLAELRKVITSGKGTPPTVFATVSPAACPGDVLAAHLPAYDPEGAKAGLEAAGWSAGADGKRSKDGTALKIILLLPSSMGTPAAAGAELAKAAWGAVGFEVDVQQLPEDQTVMILFSTGEWDVAWATLNVGSPDQFMPFVTGPGPAESGGNFSSIDNPEYAAKVAEATSQLGADSCPTWLAAEAELVKANSVTPFANTLRKMYLNGAVIDQSVSTSIPTAIEMTD
ncbi:MAG: ABC transporter substrate-binding protein [Bifidobacteriaceae bacterium]|jgi:peptide/nickel transport system substrate-binding protein|nr:ABC transporter substrate-binding protein [Bifidobacteriaceae bacterium]